METVVTVTLWILPVASVLALSTQEFLEDKVLENKQSSISNNSNTNINGMIYDLFTFKNAKVFCQSYVCGCEPDWTTTDENDVVEDYDIINDPIYSSTRRPRISYCHATEGDEKSTHSFTDSSGILSSYHHIT
jgi:hypothetical protein